MKPALRRSHSSSSFAWFAPLFGACALLLGASGCALEGEGEPIERTEQAIDRSPANPALVPAGVQTAVGQTVVGVARGPSEKQPVVVLSAPVSTNGGGVGGNDEGPRPNPWTPPPEGSEPDDGKPTVGGATNTNTSGDSKSGPTK